MTNNHQDVRSEIIQQIIKQIELKLPAEEAKRVVAFVPLFYGNAPLEDLIQRSIADLYGALMTMWDLMEYRQPNECKIRVFNPHFEQNGWQSTHTIVQIITDDMPFLVDSVGVELTRLGFTTHLIIHVGGIKVQRNQKGEIIQVLPHDADVKEAISEAPLYMEIDRQSDTQTLETIRKNLQRVLYDVRVAVADWEKMRQRLFYALEELEHIKVPALNLEEIEESKAFLRWLVNDHFTFIGYRQYELIGEGEQAALQIVPGSGLGVLRDESTSKGARFFSELPIEARKLVLSKRILIISKTHTPSTVHRRAFTDYIGVKRFDKDGNIIGEHRFIGLYTSEAYISNPKYIPFLRLKVEIVLQKSGLPHNGHAAKTLRNILETLPRDDLFQMDTDELYTLAMGILHLQERRAIRLFVYKDPYSRYFSCLVYVPRDNFNTDLLHRIQVILQKAFNGLEISYETYFGESILARIHYIVRVDPSKPLRYDEKKIEEKIIEAARSWKDDLRGNILDYFGEEKGNELANRYLPAFSAGYRETFAPRLAIYDIEHIEKLTPLHNLEMSFYRPLGAQPSVLHFKLFRPHQPIPLSDALPMLENMGLRVLGEQPYEIMFRDGATVWINDFNMVYSYPDPLDVEASKELFQEVFHRVWRGEAENDSFNRLVLRAQLSWREITVFRAYAKYLRQTGFTLSQQYIEEALAANPMIAKLLMQLFHLRFNPNMANGDERQILSLEEEIVKALDSVANLDEDRILRRYMELMRATLRTNYFQMDAEGNPLAYLSFKLDPTKIPELPLPLPMFEIFVYSPRFEGEHLRAGKVARGGIRWSDRREDFRTEVLGLMKAQQVKNAIIVPAGAKGGFVPKGLPNDASREAILQEAITCYKGFINGLLDITDNLVASEVVHPKDTVIYDGDDPYLVVAADKGTASFSDIANQIAKDYNFWLGDAFASGGSTGYDHKKMAITSRGVWESVKRHFQELGVDAQTADLTVVGIGDMSGDVFGNGMLLSEHFKLVAAFNHIHIFLDPHPDPKTSYQERLRLFNLPRSTWDDYDKSLISKGGGVYLRSSKAIKPSPEIKELLEIKKEVVTPSELIRAILKAPVDLLWNGGIGTYVKASVESNNDVGDRANDMLRINGDELRCRVVAEGGNLGLTQLGRIEYAFLDGKINTDFIDNSGGVDCSDHEVNIKILLNEVIASGDMTSKQRNTLLAQMTDEVAQLVLHNNYRQVRTITLATNQSLEYLNLYGRFIEAQEQAGKLNRQLEFLPDNKVLSERKLAGKGLTRPEIAVLLAYSKIILKEEILHTDLVEDPSLTHYMELAFPKTLIQRFPETIFKRHQLQPEIIATQLCNDLVTDMGITFAYQMQDETGASTVNIVRAYACICKIFSMNQLWADIESLDNKVNPDVQYRMMLMVIRLIRRGTRWFLRNRQPGFNIAEEAKHFSGYVEKVYQQLPILLSGEEKENHENKIQELVAANVPLDIATRITATRYIYAALNIIQAAMQNNANIDEVAIIYFTLTSQLELGWFREMINAYPVDDHWSVLARASFKDDLDYQQRALITSVLKHKYKFKAKGVIGRINNWLEKHASAVERWRRILADLRSHTTIESAMLSVAGRELFDLAECSLHHNVHTVMEEN
ncbi:MAG: NAD-glutamate dehydrogenase [Gammaproteobacteria bacterium]